ncbi:MAG: hypothetical protein P8X65_10745 [Syntrophobacterales bacterium]|jgi:hypothetical protein
MDRKTATFFLVIFMACALWLAACAGAPSSQAPSTTDLLLQTGFQAQAPVRPEHISRLPAQQFVPVHRHGQTYYVYADPGKNRLYFGNEAAYQRYKAKAAEAHAAEAQKAASSQQWSAYDWSMYAEAMGGGP